MRAIFVGCALLVAGCSAGGGAGPLASFKVGDTHADYVVVSDGGGRPGAGLGAMLLKGSWELHIGPDSNVTGTWTAHRLDPDLQIEVGPQVGAGTLVGRLHPDGSLWLNFNPGYVDNNVFVTVGPRGGDIDATWEWSTIAGRAAGGPFRVQPALP